MAPARSLPIRLHEHLRRTNAPFMVVPAAVVGLLGGYGAVLLRELIHGIQHFVWASDPHSREDDVRRLRGDG